MEPAPGIPFSDEPLGILRDHLRARLRHWPGARPKIGWGGLSGRCGWLVIGRSIGVSGPSRWPADEGDSPAGRLRAYSEMFRWDRSPSSGSVGGGRALALSGN